jgi:hypothetical protein
MRVFLDDFGFLVIIILAILMIFGGVFSLCWWSCGKQAAVYEQTTGKHVTQSDMFWGGDMFKILPKDIVTKQPTQGKCINGGAK